MFCANFWWHTEAKHKVGKGNPIYWVEEIQKNGKQKTNGYCEKCYNMKFNVTQTGQSENTADSSKEI